MIKHHSETPRLISPSVSRLGAAVVGLALLVLGQAGARAVDYYFDANGTNAGSGIVDGGAYDFAGTNHWNTTADGSGTPGGRGTRNPIFFSAGTDAAGLSYTITNVTANAEISSGVTVQEGQVTLAGGVARFYNSQTVRTLANTSLTLSNTWDFYNNTVTFDPAPGTTITLGSIATASGRRGNVTKTSPGLLLVTSAASARGIIVNVNAGVMRIQHGNAMFNPAYAANGYFVTNNGGTLELDNNIAVANNPITLNGAGYNNLGAIANYAGDNQYNSLITLGSDSRINNNATGTTLILNPATGAAITGAYGLTLGGAGNLAIYQSIDSITSLTLDGTGTVTLGSSYLLTSSPNITIGAGATLDTSFSTLTLGANQSLGGGGTLNDSLSTSSGSQILPGGGLALGRLNIAYNLTLAGGDTVAFDFSSSTNDVVSVGGDLTPNAITPTVIHLTSLPAGGLDTNQTYVLFEVTGNLNGDPANFTVVESSPQTFSISYDTGSSPKRVLLQASGSGGPQSLVWQGGQNGNAWDSATPNWLKSGNPATFYNNDLVSFTDAGTANPPVIHVPVNPGAVTVSNTAPNPYWFSGTAGMAGSTALTKQGNGALILANPNTYTGGTLVAGGALVFTNGGSVAGTITSDASVIFSRTDAGTVTNPITGGGSVTQVGSGDLTLSGTLSVGGTVSVSGGANLNVSGSVSAGSLANTGAGTLALAGALSSGGLVNSGGGTVVVTGEGTYGGGTLNSSGMLLLGNGGATGALGTGPVTNQGTLILNFGANNVAFTNPVSGAGTVIKEGAGVLTLSGDSTYTGLTLISAGQVQVASANALGATSGGTVVSSVSVTSLRLLGDVVVAAEPLAIAGGNPALGSVSGSNVWTGPVTISNELTRISALGTSTLRLAGPIGSSGFSLSPTHQYTLGFRNDAGGTVILSAANNYSGDTALFSGTARLDGHHRLPTSTVLLLGINASNPNGVFDLNGWNQEVAGLQMFQLGQAGTSAVLTNSSANASTLTVNALSSTVIPEGNPFTRGTFLDFAGSLGGNLSLVKTGPGLLMLSGANSHAGATVVDNGTLLINGNNGSSPVVVNSGTVGGVGIIAGNLTNVAGILAPGTNGIGTLTVNGALSLNGGSQTSVDINSDDGASDLVIGPASVNFGGTLVVNNLGTQPVTNGQSFQLFSTGSPAGNFSGINPAGPGNGLTWSFNAATGFLSAQAAAANATLTNSFSGGWLTLSWPDGWTLQAQTNNLATGLSTNWTDVPSNSPAVFAPVPANGAVFYRLKQ